MALLIDHCDLVPGMTFATSRRGKVPNEQWYICRDGRQVGPMSRQQIEQFKNTGKLAPTDDVWTNSMQDWKLASDVFNFESREAPARIPVGHTRAKVIIVGVAASLVAVISCVIAFQSLLNGSSQAKVPMKVVNVKDLPPDINSEIKSAPEFAHIVRNPDPKSQFVSFEIAYLRGYRGGWQYEVAVKWLHDVTVKKIIINRNPDCSDDTRIGEKPEGYREEITNLCTGSGAIQSYNILARGSTTTPIPINEITFETNLGTFSYDTRGLTLREQTFEDIKSW
jgi:hypothetical protein